MLKIKDNVDLKELEMFEFIYNQEVNGYTRLVDKNDAIKKQCFVYIASGVNSINIGFIPKVIYLCTPFGMKELEGKSFEYIIEDLIKADLVEMVGS